MRSPLVDRVALRVVAGPAATARFAVRDDEVALAGRARGCAVRLDDPAVEAHHCSLAVVRGRLLVRQLTGRAPIVVDGVPIGAAPAAVGYWLELGATRLAVDRVGDGELVDTGAGVLGVDVVSGAAVVLGATFRLGIVAEPTHPDHRAMTAAVEAAAPPCADVVVAVAGAPELDTCTTLVELGTRWRARLTPDRGDPLTIIRVHLRHGVCQAHSVTVTGARGDRR